MSRIFPAAVVLAVGSLLSACGGASLTAATSTTSTIPSSSSSSAGTTTTSGAAATTSVITPGTTATCEPVTEPQIADRFTRWNDDLTSGSPDRVVENYASDSILVPTVSNKVRRTAAEKKDYFEHFLADKPTGVIDFSDITLGCNMAVDSGLYTFTYRATGKKVQARYTFTYHWDGREWLIVSHHSSGMPEPMSAASPTMGGTATRTATNGTSTSRATSGAASTSH